MEYCSKLSSDRKCRSWGWIGVRCPLVLYHLCLTVAWFPPVTLGSPIRKNKPPTKTSRWSQTECYTKSWGPGNNWWRPPNFNACETLAINHPDHRQYGRTLPLFPLEISIIFSVMVNVRLNSKKNSKLVWLDTLRKKNNFQANCAATSSWKLGMIRHLMLAVIRTTCSNAPVMCYVY